MHKLSKTDAKNNRIVWRINETDNISVKRFPLSNSITYKDKPLYSVKSI